MPDEQVLGLRERKKLDTRMALSDATLELLFERGLENVRREDIAARAGVSVRTFNNYFSGLYEAVAYRQVERIRRTIAVLRACPADEPLWSAIVSAVLEPWEVDVTGTPPRAHLTEIAKVLDRPEMQLVISKVPFEELVSAIADRTGTDPAHEVYPRLVAGAIAAAYRAAIEVYLRAEPPVLITTVLRRALTELAAGLPDPSAGH